ncbi:MAG: tRNA-specific adenosine deaminase [Candidatus Omnitrophica bacterium CG11_big_fil_rev_8_21_14_0_20_41_12]|nr:MAG: tRNA-specific adenosine deaminase [Candidatus Omnitrophica bacterium CG11_big_fil_rev_8_21_14_0_20_41_12]
MKNQDIKFMKLAIGKAKAGIKKDQAPFGACIVKNNKVVALSHNLVWKNSDITAHAEIMAIRSACKVLKKIDLSGCTIYSTCEPCPMCFSACHWAGLTSIVFGAKIEDAKKFGFNELAVSNFNLKKIGKSKIKLTAGLLAEENLALFKFWKKQPKSKAY